MLWQAIFLVVLSVASCGSVGWMLRDADRRYFPATYLTSRTPEVLPLIDTYTPLDWKGLV